jgi:hypothetical protein
LNRRIAVLQTAPLTTWVCRPVVTKRLTWQVRINRTLLLARFAGLNLSAEGQDGAGDGDRTRDFNLGKVALYR